MALCRLNLWLCFCLRRAVFVRFFLDWSAYLGKNCAQEFQRMELRSIRVSGAQKSGLSFIERAERRIYYFASFAAIVIGLGEFVHVLSSKTMMESYLAAFMSAVGVLFLASLRLSEKLVDKNEEILANDNSLRQQIEFLVKRDGLSVKVCRSMKESCELISSLVGGMTTPKRVLLCAMHAEQHAKLMAPPEMGHKAFVDAMKKSVNDLDCEHKEIYNVFSIERLGQIEERLKTYQQAHNYESRAYSSREVPAGLLLIIIGDDNVVIAVDHAEFVGPDWTLHLKGREYVEFAKLHFDRLWD